MNSADRFQNCINAIEAISIAARWRVSDRITIDFVAGRITKGDRARAFTALDALVVFGALIVALIVEETNGERVYRVAEE